MMREGSTIGISPLARERMVHAGTAVGKIQTLAEDSGALLHLIGSFQPLAPNSGALMHLIGSFRTLAPNSGALMHLIGLFRTLAPNSGALLHLIGSFRPLALNSGALLHLIGLPLPTRLQKQNHKQHHSYFLAIWHFSSLPLTVVSFIACSTSAPLPFRIST